MAKKFDDRVIEYVFPTRVLDASSSVKNAEGLLEEKVLQIGFNENNLTEIKGKGRIVLDFGKEMQGGVRILSREGDNATINIRFGESVQEAITPLGVKNTTNDHSPRDFKGELKTLSDVTFGNTGFRFVCIETLEDNANVKLKSVVAKFEYRDLEYKGSFECNDETINKIFDTAAYTCHLNMQNMLWDGIKRDRLVWIGDTHPEMMTIRSIFGADKCIEEALTFTRNDSPLPLWINNFPTYSMWWIIILNDYFMQVNNAEYTKNNLDYVEGLINQLNGLVDEKGNCDLGQYFLDWPTFGTEDAPAGVRSLFILAVKAAINLFNIFGVNTDVAELLLDKLHRKSFSVTWAKQSLAFQVLSGVVDPKDAYDFLTKDGAKGMSTFTAFYLLKAVSLSGDTKTALQMMKDYYGGMLSRGATSFWEDFSIDWLKGSGRIDEMPKEGEIDIHGDFGAFCYVGFRHSLCHGWASGPVPFIMERVLGISILEPGCKKLSIKPNLCGLKWMKGKYPTPYGIVEIEVKDENGTISTKINAPSEIVIVK